jgi:hypothetical protein
MSPTQCERCHGQADEFIVCGECDAMCCHACILSPEPDCYLCDSCDSLINGIAADADWNPPEPDPFWKMTVVSALLWAVIAMIALVLYLCSLACPAV